MSFIERIHALTDNLVCFDHIESKIVEGMFALKLKVDHILNVGSKKYNDEKLENLARLANKRKTPPCPTIEQMQQLDINDLVKGLERMLDFKEIKANNIQLFKQDCVDIAESIVMKCELIGIPESRDLLEQLNDFCYSLDELVSSAANIQLCAHKLIAEHEINKHKFK
eukprot:NODE_299_length_10456_cov_1.003669.p10 type:complete len:168 gc:universal NODE_299_length_10456_cov_1.003669:5851-5348(-)